MAADLQTTLRALIAQWRERGCKLCPFVPAEKLPLTGWTLQQSQDRMLGAILQMHADELEAALSSLAGEWQPIETAPKDGTWLLLRCADMTLPEVGHWYQGYPVDAGVPNRGWWVSHALPVQPTHWMPLPAPPSAGGAVPPSEPGESEKIKTKT